MQVSLILVSFVRDYKFTIITIQPYFRSLPCLIITTIMAAVPVRKIITVNNSAPFTIHDADKPADMISQHDVKGNPWLQASLNSIGDVAIGCSGPSVVNIFNVNTGTLTQCIETPETAGTAAACAFNPHNDNILAAGCHSLLNQLLIILIFSSFIYNRRGVCTITT